MAMVNDFRFNNDPLMFQQTDASYCYSCYDELNEIIARLIGIPGTIRDVSDRALFSGGLAYAAIGRIPEERIAYYRGKYSELNSLVLVRMFMI